ncbi:MAG: 1,4-alpha-glucan branching enzyme GlgB, partial [Planctomycetota bacterium]
MTLGNMGALVEGNLSNPFEILGPHEVEHQGRKALAIRAYLPGTKQVWVLDQSHGVSRPMRRIHPAGVYEAICPMSGGDAGGYQLRVANERGQIMTMQDPYAFPTYFTDFDLYLLGEGTHYQSYDRLGAQLRTVNGVTGVNFAVWAPNAGSVSVVGDFNQWDGRQHMMRKHVPSGIWELFVPGLQAGMPYKFRVRTRWGESIDKSDPYGFAAELPPCTASIVAD